jgi:hypothetical protein
LENHADVATQVVYVELSVNVNVPDLELPLDTAAGDEVIHAVEAFEKGGFSASRRPYEGGYLLFGNFHADVLYRLKITVP